MIYLVSQALDGLNRQIALGLVYTKTDLVGRPSASRNGVFNGLIQSSRGNEKVRNRGAVIHIACGNRPVNVAKPVLFAVHVGIRDEVKRLEEAERARRGASENFSKHASVLDDFFSWLRRSRPIASWPGGPAWMPTITGRNSPGWPSRRSNSPLISQA